MFILSIIGSFFGGMAALFAPCCVTILLPLYLGTIFKQKIKVVLMTLIFGLGIATVLVPISLGVGFLAEFLHIYHRQFYIFGGIMLVLTAVILIFGIKIPMPRIKKPAALGSYSGSYSLGIFSGIASACCAPVLAGSIALALASGTFAKAFIVSAFYILGMIVPLFILALVWDKFKISEIKIFKGGNLKIAAGVIFGIVGLIMFYLGATGNEFWAPQWQVNFADYLRNVTRQIIEFLKNGELVGLR